MRRDALGRRRTADQERGLRPLHPPLPAGTVSRSVRVAMTREAWSGLEEIQAERTGVTAPRVVGELLERAVTEHRAGPAVADWQEWQIRKEQRLLAPGEDEAVAS